MADINTAAVSCEVNPFDYYMKCFFTLSNLTDFLSRTLDTTPTAFGRWIARTEDPQKRTQMAMTLRTRIDSMEQTLSAIKNNQVIDSKKAIFLIDETYAQEMKAVEVIRQAMNLIKLSTKYIEEEIAPRRDESGLSVIFREEWEKVKKELAELVS